MRSVSGSRVAAALTALLLLAGCGGGASSGGLGSTLPKQANGATNSVRFAITVPPKTASSGRSPAYVSPATQSMTIAVLQGTTNVLNQTLGLTPSSPGCTTSLAGTVCTISLSLAAGSYTASITTYDGANGTGNALSTAQSVGFSVTANQNNLVPLTLSGIPRAIHVASAGVNAVDVVAQDADGNFIVGAGAPTFTASASSGPALATIVQPTASHPNLISFVRASPAVLGTETFAVAAGYPAGESNACTQTGAVCSLASAMTATVSAPMAMVANSGGNTVLGYTLPLTSATQSPAVSIPLYTAYLLTEDASGNVFAASFTSPTTTVLEIPPPYTSATLTNSLGGDDSYQMAVAPNGDLALANIAGIAGGSLYAPPYTAAPSAITSGLSGGAVAVAFDASNNLYFGNSGASTLAMLAPPYTGSPTTVSLSSVANGLTVSGTTLFVGETSDVDVFSLPLTASSTPIATLSNGIGTAYRSAVDASGNIWVANSSGGTSSNGSIEEFTEPFSTGETPAVTISMPVGGGSTSYNTLGIAFDAAGNLYVTNRSGGAGSGGLLEFSPPITSASKPTFAIETSNLNSLFDLVITRPALSVTP